MKKKDLTWICIGHTYAQEDKDIFDFLTEKGIKFIFCDTENDFWEFILQQKKEDLAGFGLLRDLIPYVASIRTIYIPTAWTGKTEEVYEGMYYEYATDFYNIAILPYWKPPLILNCKLTPPTPIQNKVNELRKKGIKVNFLNAWRYMEEYRRIFEGE